MKKRFCLALIIAGFAGFSAAAGNPQAGKEKAAACGGCHGEDGNNAAEIFAALKAPKLAGQLPEYIAKQIHDFKAGRRANEQMTPQAQAVAEADIADIAAYFGQQKPTPAEGRKDLAAQGEKLFYKGKGRPAVVAACVGCHGLKGVGRGDWNRTYSRAPVVLAPALGGQHAAYIAAQLKAYKDGARNNDPAKVMRDIAGRLDEQDIAAVSEYLATVVR
ncbi:MAG: c-type cytochrome [Rhodocyclaceae bacterium]|nr:c-type cytochrome [Rhodocyclaceae bacterium]